MKAWLAILVVVCLGTLLSACDESPSEAIRFGLQSPVQTLDPRFATDAASTRVARLVYSQLVDFGPDFKPLPALARWQQLSPHHYRFTLDPKRATFHDGTLLTAADVVATYRSVLDAATASPHRGSLSMISTVEALNNETIDFRLSRADALFPGRLVIGILPAQGIAVEQDFARHPIGNGPFAFEGWPDTERVRLRRRADGQSVEFLRVRRADVRVLKLLRGEIDVIQGDLPPELLGWLADRDDVVISSVPGTTFAYVGFNLEDPVVGDVRVRRAIAHAIDRSAIIRHVFAGKARHAGGILTPNHWAGHSGLRGLDYDLSAARRLLAAAGYDEKRPVRIVYKTSTNPVRVRIASIIQDQLAQVGIDVDIRTYDWGTFYGDIKAGNFQMYSLAWVGIKMPDIFRYVFHSESIPPAGANRGRFIDAGVDRLIDRAEGAPEVEQRARLYQELQQHLAQALPYVSLWYEDQVAVTRRDVVGYRVAVDGNFDGLIDAVRRFDGADPKP